MTTPLGTLPPLSYQLEFPVQDGLLGKPQEMNSDSFVKANSLIKYPRGSVFNPHAQEVAEHALQHYKPSPTLIRAY